MNWLLSAAVLCAQAAAQEKSTNQADLPKDVAIEEQYVLLAAKVKSLGEIQDLILKQQQLILQNLDVLRNQTEHFGRERTNLITRRELEGCLAQLENWRLKFESEQQTNFQTVLKALQEATSRPVASKPAAGTNYIPGTRFEGYRVQPSDTLSKIVIRLNDGFDKRGLQRVTQEQIERANPGLDPDLIRVGQLLLIPLPETKP